MTAIRSSVETLEFKHPYPGVMGDEDLPEFDQIGYSFLSVHLPLRG